MQSTPTYRWGLGFIALRWRLVFWLLPLLGLVIGLGPQFWKLYGPTATGFIRVSPLWISPPLTYPPEIANLLQSEELLSKTAHCLDLSGRWAVDADYSVANLRRMIRSEVVPGTTLVELRVSGPSRREAIEIWNTLVGLANRHFLDARQAVADAKSEANNATTEELEQHLKETQHKLIVALRQRAKAVAEPDSSDQENFRELEQLRADLYAAENALSKDYSRRFPSTIACGTPIAPILVHEAPPVFFMSRWDTIRPLAIHASAGFSIGVIIMTPVAYLLELLRPRR